MNRLWLIATLLAIFTLIQSPNVTSTFCSVTCGKITCVINDTSTSGCTACNTGWVLNDGVCSPNTIGNYYLFNKTNDIGGSLIVSPSNTPSGICSGKYGSVGYTAYGWYNAGIGTIISVS